MKLNYGTLIAVSAAWTKVTNKENKINPNTKDGTNPVEVVKREILETEKVIRTVRAVLEGMKENENPTNIQRIILKWTKGVWSREAIEILSLKLSTRKKKLRNKLKKVIERERSRKWNDTSIHNETRVYDWMRKIIQEDPENITPMPKKKERNQNINQSSEDNVTINTRMINAPVFWEKIWSTNPNVNFNAEWIQETKNLIKEKLNQTNEELNPESNSWQFENEEMKKIVMNKKNWNAPGWDGICNYWWKKIDSSWKYLLTELKTLAETEKMKLPDWLVVGKTILIHKDGSKDDNANYRPITCLNTMYNQGKYKGFKESAEGSKY